MALGVGEGCEAEKEEPECAVIGEAVWEDEAVDEGAAQRDCAACGECEVVVREERFICMSCIKCKQQINGPYFAYLSDTLRHGTERWHLCHDCLCVVMLNLANSSDDRHRAFLNIMRGHARE